MSRSCERGPAILRTVEGAMRRIVDYLKDERGIETLEWIVVGGIIAGVAVVVYQGAFTDGLKTAIDSILATVKKGAAGGP
jgi:Flp pilus assembly pilin Flp